MARIDQIKKILANNPDDVFLNFSLAMEYQSGGQIEEAIRQFDRTIALDGRYLAAYIRKSQVLMTERRFEEARKALEAGLEVARAANDGHMIDNITQLLAQLP